MRKNKFVQIGFRILVLGIFLWGVALSLGAQTPKPNFYVYYTNISNYLCVAVVLAEIIINIVQVSKKNTVGNKDLHSALKFCVLIGITVTFLVANTLLDHPFKAEYWTSAGNVLMHMVNPLLFCIDWLVFAEHGNTKWTYPLYSTIFPLIYVVYIFIRAAIIGGTIDANGFQNGVCVYPYFFLDLANTGVAKVIGWIAILVVVFVALGYLIYSLDNIKNFKAKHQAKKLK